MLFRNTKRALHKLSKFSRGYLNSSFARVLDVHPEVLDALASKKPVVALETTLVTHGFPYPTNFELSNSLESIVRSTGAIPATIGIIEGRIKIGLEKAELERLANPEKPGSVVKISRRDISPAVSMKAFGGTTCSATLIFAALAGIKVFATGGLGGVHRGGESSMDISADLQELTRCPVGLVSSGVKSILDIGRTLEYLETLGVPVISYGPSKEFPAFFTPRSGFQVPWNTESPSVAANILYTQSQLGMQNGALFAVPIPEAYEAAGADIQLAVDRAVAESEVNGISKRGKEATPWLLNRIGELSMGSSLVSNVALLENNARIGGEIAVEYQKLAEEQPHSSDFVTLGFSTPFKQSARLQPSSSEEEPLAAKNDNASLLVLGAAAVDISAKAFEAAPRSAFGSTTPGTIAVSLGGVARNIAEASHRVSPKDSVLLLSPIGDDAFGHLLTKETEKSGMRTDGLLLQKDQRTAVCNIVLDSRGGLTTGIADMAILETTQFKTNAIEIIQRTNPAILIVDGNCSPAVISTVAKLCIERSIKVLVPHAASEPTSVVKSTRILDAMDDMASSISPIDFISPNLVELREIFEAANGKDLLTKPDYWIALDNFSLTSRYRMDLEHLSRANVSDEDHSKGTLSFLLDQGIAQMAIKLLPFFGNIIIKCGDKGVLVAMRQSSTSQWRSEHSNIKAHRIVNHSNTDTIVLSHFPALPVENLVNVTGAGDSFVGALGSCLVQQPNALNSPETLADVIGIAQRAAVLTLCSPYAVSPDLSILEEAVVNLQ
ncbi:indigoidine synthase A-like protein [Lentinula aciculospora]|uniref:Indigoidine synthase A-like protein n=1 Tax=Lentinula aciculospora TaxID=153920 RepID=A0A9W9ALY0_9AGAR|nr:indigoidine synthase A-like protein [Lentinula aciculospora]